MFRINQFTRVSKFKCVKGKRKEKKELTKKG